MHIFPLSICKHIFGVTATSISDSKNKFTVLEKRKCKYTGQPSADVVTPETSFLNGAASNLHLPSSRQC